MTSAALLSMLRFLLFRRLARLARPPSVGVGGGVAGGQGAGPVSLLTEHENNRGPSGAYYSNYRRFSGSG